ncbi:PGF-pre-PGF domain-containing protein [Candidatus Woesearchaeota archaeon]|nr:PGF-pre-PGF domain-containing protein [Candidatus Woesearchaeota archaeon]
MELIPGYFVNTSFDTTLLADGIYNITVFIANRSANGTYNVTNEDDHSGLNVGYNWTIISNVTIDNTAPGVVIYNVTNDPAGNYSFGAAGDLNFNTSDSTPQIGMSYNDTWSDIATCSLYIGSGELGLTDIVNTSTQVSFSEAVTFLQVDTTLDDGWYNVSVNCTDASSNIGQSSPVFNLTVDATLPSVSINNPSAGYVNFSAGENVTSPTGNYTFNTTVTDAFVGIANVTLRFDNDTWNSGTIGAITVTLDNDSGQDNYSTRFNISSLEEGFYTAYVIANDTFNNTNQTEFFYFIVDRTQPNVTVINISMNTSTGTPSIGINYNDSLSRSASCTVYLNGTIWNTTTINNGSDGSSGYNFTNATILTSGDYNVSANCTDGSGLIGSSWTGGSDHVMSIDTVLPNITFVYPFSEMNFSEVTNNVTFNISINDSSADVRFNLSYVSINFDNASSEGIGNPFNYSEGELVYDCDTLGCWYSISVNVSGLDEGEHTLRVYANDTLNNLNSTETLTFTVDRTGPNVTSGASSITSTTAIISAGVNESAGNCSIVSPATGLMGVTDESAQTWTYTVTGLTAATSYTATVNCTDPSGHYAKASYDFTTLAADAAAAAASGGSSGGSGGGVSANVVGEYAKEIWTSINAGETATVIVDNGAVGVTSVDFSTAETVWGAWVKVAKIDSPPSSVKTFTGKVYRNIEITKGVTLTDELLSNPVVNFKIAKAWLTENGLTQNNVALFRYANDDWIQLSTVVGEDDGTYIHFSATTPGFSYFVIGEKTGDAVVAPTGEAEASVGDDVTGATTESGDVTEETTGVSGWVWWLIVIIIIIAVVAIVVGMRNRNQ